MGKKILKVRCSRWGVEHSSRHTGVKGLSPGPTAGTVKEKMGKSSNDKNFKIVGACSQDFLQHTYDLKYGMVALRDKAY